MQNNQEEISCLLCGAATTVSTNSTGEKESKCSRFAVLLARFLNLDVPNLSPETTQTQGLVSVHENPFITCDECLPLVEAFSGLYQQLNYIELQLNWTVQEVAAVVKEKERKGGKPEEKFSEIKCRFRQAVLKKADLRKKNIFPRLKTVLSSREELLEKACQMNGNGTTHEVSEAENDDEMENNGNHENANCSSNENEATFLSSGDDDEESPMPNRGWCRLCRRSFFSRYVYDEHMKLHETKKRKMPRQNKLFNKRQRRRNPRKNVLYDQFENTVFSQKLDHDHNDTKDVDDNIKMVENLACDNDSNNIEKENENEKQTESTCLDVVNKEKCNLSVCTFCEFKCDSPGELETHLRVHVEETLCHDSFGVSNELEEHKRQHHDQGYDDKEKSQEQRERESDEETEKNNCDEPFATANGTDTNDDVRKPLKLVLKINSNDMKEMEEQFRCKFCPKWFRKEKKLIRHFIRHHSVRKPDSDQINDCI